MANGYPIDQRGNTGSVGDDTPTEHAAWTLQLQAAGLPGSPIEKQTAMLTIDHGNDRDYISDKGDEVWNVIEGNGIKNVLIMGALHTCSACRALPSSVSMPSVLLAFCERISPVSSTALETGSHVCCGQGCTRTCACSGGRSGCARWRGWARTPPSSAT